MKLNVMVTTAALALMAASAANAATYNYGYTYNGSTMVLDASSADPTGQAIAIGDTFTLVLKAQANKAWQANASFRTSFDGSVNVTGCATRTGNMSATRSLNGASGGNTTINPLYQGCVHAGGQNVEYTSGEIFDELTISYTLLDDGGVGTTIQKSGLIFGGFWQNANISYIDVADESVSEVPLPAAGWMLLVGLGGMMAFRRKSAA